MSKNFGEFTKTSHISNCRYVVGFTNEEANGEAALDMVSVLKGYQQMGINGELQLNDGAGNSVLNVYQKPVDFMAESVSIQSMGFGEYVINFVEPFWNPLTDYILFSPFPAAYESLVIPMLGFQTATAAIIALVDKDGNPVDSGVINFNCQIFKGIVL